MPSHGLRTPACRRANALHTTDSTPNAATYQRPDHFTPHASPTATPAPNRHHRNPSHGPYGELSIHPSRTASASRVLIWSRSTSRQPNAITTNTARKMSSIPIRDCTCDTPSQISSTPAMAPSRSDPVSRRAIRMTSRMLTVPATAEANRHPNPS